MKTSGMQWSLAGVVAGLAGLGTSYLTASLMSLRESPVVAVAETIIRITPGSAVEFAIQLVGTNDKPILVGVILTSLVLLFALIGRLGRRGWWLPAVGFGAIAVLGAVATLTSPGAVPTDLAPILVGFVTWVVTLSPLTERLRRIDERLEAEAKDAGHTGPDLESPVGVDVGRDRRSFLAVSGAVLGVAAVTGVVGRFAGGARRKVDEARRLLRLRGVSTPEVPPDVRVGVEGVTPWMTPAKDFYLIDTAIIKPTIAPSDWTLRIHGLVENEIEISYDELVARQFTEAWITLNCVSNEVGGSLIGNAWWSGVPLADLLAEAGPLPEADAVLQTSEDGWNCGTPLAALLDGRQAMLAVAMNGEPLLIEHGFPVRTIVPGLYGYVSGTKWVVDMEVTRFADISAYWTDRGWGEMGPVKMSSRVEVPTYDEQVAAGDVVVAGTAWSQHTGIAGVEVAVDGGEWQAAEIAGTPSDDTWVQWRATVGLGGGDHTVRVRATDKEGLVQTGAVADVLPDGATGWHEVPFSVSA